MPVGLVAAGIGAAGVIGGAVISSNASKSASNTAAAGTRDAQAQQARQFDAATAEQSRQFDASQAAIREGTANANEVQGQQHGSTLDTLGGLYRSSTDTINAGYADAKAANQPYLASGTSALNRLAQIYGLDSTDANGNIVKGTPGGNLDPNATFYQSPDYQFRLNEGVKGVDTGASARHMLDSGATRKAEIKYAGNLASGEFGNYAARLASLAGIGQNAANTNATGATNYASAITANNNNYGSNVANENAGYATRYGNAQLDLGTNIASTGSAYGNNFANQSIAYGNNYATSVQNAANNQANATLANGANTSNAINGVAGSAANYFNNPNRSPFGSSYPPGQSSGSEFGWT